MLILLITPIIILLYYINRTPILIKGGKSKNILSYIPEIIESEIVKFPTEEPPDLIKLVKKYDNVEVVDMIYKSGKLKIHGYICRSKNITTETPVVIYCRGGNNKKQGGIGDLSSEFIIRSGLLGLLDLVNRGKIIVFASNYRGSSRSEGNDDFGGDDVNDILYLYPIIQKYKFANSNKIAILGISRGVMMALMTMKKSNWIKCAILASGDSNLLRNKITRPGMYRTLTEKWKYSIKDLEKRSAINWIDKLPKIPILILHGTADWRETVENSIDLAKELYKHKVPYKLVIYPGATHSLFENKKEVEKEVENHLENYLIEDKKINLEPRGF